nr:hypothetical protein [uncultured Rhodoferax sp.]
MKFRPLLSCLELFSAGVKSAVFFRAKSQEKDPGFRGFPLESCGFQRFPKCWQTNCDVVLMTPFSSCKYTLNSSQLAGLFFALNQVFAGLEIQLFGSQE